MNNLKIAKDLIRLARMIIGANLKPEQEKVFSSIGGGDPDLYSNLNSFLNKEGWKIKNPSTSSWYSCTLPGNKSFEVTIAIEKDTSASSTTTADKLMGKIDSYHFLSTSDYEYNIKGVTRTIPLPSATEFVITLEGKKEKGIRLADHLGYFENVNGKIDVGSGASHIDARVSDAYFSICDQTTISDYDSNKTHFNPIGIWWEDGTWNDGTWTDGIWLGGTWEGGTWEDGIWKEGTWEDGTWKKGTWNGGTWNNGTWKGGTWNTGEDKNGKTHGAGDSPDKWGTP